MSLNQACRTIKPAGGRPCTRPSHSSHWALPDHVPNSRVNDAEKNCLKPAISRWPRWLARQTNQRAPIPIPELTRMLKRACLRSDYLVGSFVQSAEQNQRLKMLFVCVCMRTARVLTCSLRVKRRCARTAAMVGNTSSSTLPSPVLATYTTSPLVDRIYPAPSATRTSTF